MIANQQTADQHFSFNNLESWKKQKGSYPYDMNINRLLFLRNVEEKN